MAEENYTCNTCGKTFEIKPATKRACPVCGSLDIRKASETASSGCGKSTRFS